LMLLINLTVLSYVLGDISNAVTEADEDLRKQRSQVIVISLLPLVRALGGIVPRKGLICPCCRLFPSVVIGHHFRQSSGPQARSRRVDLESVQRPPEGGHGGVQPGLRQALELSAGGSGSMHLETRHREGPHHG